MNTTGKIKKITYIALGVAILAICSWIMIPFGTVPFTMQTFAVSLLIIVLGSRDAFWSLLAYLLIGIVGVPVFAGFSGGIAPFLAPTGGFLIGFIPMIFVSGILLKVAGGKPIYRILAIEAGTLCCYACGVVYTCILFMGRNMSQTDRGGTGTSLEIGAILMMTVVPYIIPDIIKNVLGVLVGEKIWKRIN